MPSLFFTNAWMLAGLVALSVPILIHLLLRRKKKRARFSTLQFFVRQDEQSSRRRKLRNWLLLALRLAVCALLVFAFARPYLPNQGAATPGQTQRWVVLVLDQSLSMQSKGAGDSKWSRAKAAAHEILTTLKADDRAALIACGPRAEVLAEWAPAGLVSRRLDSVEPGTGVGSLADGLQRAMQLLSLANRPSGSTVYLISDLQRNSCHNLANCTLAPEAELKVIQVGDLLSPNLTVADLQLGRAGGAPPQATLVSYSDEDAPAVKLELSIDGQLTPAGTLSLAAGMSTNLEFILPYLHPGWHDISYGLQANDALPADNARHQAVFIPEPVQAWVIEPRQAVRSFEEESFFVSAALDPTAESTNRVQSQFTSKKIFLDELFQRLSPDQMNLPCEWVILPGLKQMPAGLGNSLARFVKRGGGLLLFLGDAVSANRYNAEFREILPARLDRAEAKPDAESYWRIAQCDTNNPIFAAFQMPNSGTLGLVRFTKRFALQAADARQVLSRFDDTMPALVAGQVGLGRVVLVNTSADTSWSDWPKRKSFVPWLHGVGKYLAQSARPDPRQTLINAVTGSTEDIELGTNVPPGACTLVTPRGQERALTPAGEGTLRDVTFFEPGVYKLRAPSGLELRRISANVPPTESDLSALAATEVQQLVGRSTEPRQAGLAAGLFGASGNQREFWRVLLLTVLGLLFVETLVANRTLG